MDRESYSTTHSNTINKGNIRNFQVANKMIELIFFVKEFTLLWGTFNREKSVNLKSRYTLRIKQICNESPIFSFVFWENSEDHKLLSRFTKRTQIEKKLNNYIFCICQYVCWVRFQQKSCSGLKATTASKGNQYYRFKITQNLNARKSLIL